jgi:hypothetical protein
MKRTANLLTPKATRLAVSILALTVVLGTPMSAKPNNAVHSNAAVRRSAPPQRPAARSSAPAMTARPNTMRPNTARPAATGQNAANRPNTARPNNTAHANTPQSRPAPANTPHANNQQANAVRPNTAPGNAGRGTVAHNGSGQAGQGGGALHGGRQISDARFRSSFGSAHQFHVGHPIMIGGQASFQFGGLWFGIVDPWPAAWLYTDAVYVDFIAGGYVLVNVVHPGIQIAVAVGDPVPAPAVCPPSVVVSSISGFGDSPSPR